MPGLPIYTTLFW